MPRYDVPAAGGTVRTIGLVIAALIASCGGRHTPEPPVAAGASGQHLKVGSTRLYFEVHGAGRPLLLLHGGLGSTADFARNIGALSKHFKVVAFDRRGHGRSHDDGAAFSYAEMADETKAFLDALGITAASVVGFSDGGVVGYHLASKYPAAVTALVAVGANAVVAGMSEATIEWTRTRLTVEGIARDYPAIERTYRAGSPQPDRYASFLVRTRDLWLRDPYIGRDSLRAIRAPVLLMAGDRDDILPTHMLELYATIPGARLCLVPGATHFLLAEKSEIANAIILDFLK